MKRSVKQSLFVAGLVMLGTMGIAGATTGTLAWYAYATRAKAQYVGTSIRRSEQLQVGLVDDASVLDHDYCASHNLLEVDVDSHRIVFAETSGGFAPETIRDYLRLGRTYAPNEIPPVSSRGISIDGSLSLYKSLIASKDETIHDNTELAVPLDYVKIPFAFRIVNTVAEYQVNQHVWISNMDAGASANKNTHKAIRTYFENINEGTHFLVSPSSELGADDLELRKTRIAGVLDLNGDGYYDYDEDTMREIVYGTRTDESISYSSEPFTGPEEVVDVNGVNESPIVASTFTAKHKTGVYVADISHLDCTYAYYDTLSTIAPTETSSGSFVDNSGKPVAKTNSNGVGYTDLTIYLEGWDFAVDDRIISTEFNLGIQFEINRL